VIVGSVFGYYLGDIRGRWQVKAGQSKMIGWGAGAFILATIIGGFFIVGSPMTQRDLRFDQDRIYDLQSIQYQIINFWQTKQRLPQALNELSDPLVGFIVPADPQKNEPYEYTVAQNLTFELCATFSKPIPKNASQVYPRGDNNEIWDHPAGRHCFERTVDPERFPSIDKATALPPVPTISY